MFGLRIDQDLWLAMSLIIIGIIEFIFSWYIIKAYLNLNKTLTIDLSEIILDKVACITLAFICCSFIFALLTEFYVKFMLNGNYIRYTSHPNYISIMLFFILFLPNLLFCVVSILDSKISLINKKTYFNRRKDIMLNSLKLTLYTAIIYTLCLFLCIMYKLINN